MAECSMLPNLNIQLRLILTALQPLTNLPNMRIIMPLQLILPSKAPIPPLTKLIFTKIPLRLMRPLMRFQIIFPFTSEIATWDLTVVRAVG